MLYMLKLLALTPLALALGVLGGMGHPTSMQNSMHQTQKMHHAASSSANCATLCRTAVVNKPEKTVNIDDSIDDEDNSPVHATQLDRALSDYLASAGRRYVANFHPPPKLGAYILYGVYRS